MKAVKTTEEFFYDACDNLTKKITLVEEYETQTNNGSPTPVTITPYPSWVMPPQYKTDITCELSTKEATDGFFALYNLMKNPQ